MKNAWTGWLSFTDAGKLSALFIALMAYLLLGGKQKGPQGRLVLYGSIAAGLCILPPTAALLIEYQTLFYDYPWIWSLVPLTAGIALGGTVFLTDQWEEGQGWKSLCKNTVLTLLCVSVLALAGGLGRGKEVVRATVWEQETAPIERDHAAAVLAEVQKRCGNDLCLWAPQELLEHARSTDGRIRLLYGRNMWDMALNAYSYDKYPEEAEELYLWMEHLREYGAEITEQELREYVQKAFDMGADCILLPDMGENYKGAIEELAESVEVDGFWGENYSGNHRCRYYLVRELNAGGSDSGRLQEARR